VILGPRIVLPEWHHLAVVTRTGQTTLYFDGQEGASDYVLLDTPKWQTVALGHFSKAHRLKGALDEVTVYNRALTLMEIRRIFLAGSAGKCPPL
jgi:hypothetical protein